MVKHVDNIKQLFCGLWINIFFSLHYTRRIILEILSLYDVSKIIIRFGTRYSFASWSTDALASRYIRLVASRSFSIPYICWTPTPVNNEIPYSWRSYCSRDILNSKTIYSHLSSSQWTPYYWFVIVFSNISVYFI